MRVGLAILVCLLMLYSPIELTRVIFAWGPLDVELTFELCFLWTCYLVALGLIYRLLLRR